MRFDVNHFKNLQGQLTMNASLAEYTSWQVGGPADCLYIPANVEDAAIFLQQVPKEVPILWLGLGSNMLIRDAGVEGVVIVTRGTLATITQLDDTHIKAEAGVACAQIARYSARLGLTGIEFLAGVPGTVGGALAMNAGCWGGETWSFVSQVETVNRHGQLKHRDANEYSVGYRHVARPQDEWFVAGYFSLQQGDKEKSLSEIRTLLEKRSASQPTGLPNCGSVFRNPANTFAGKLIEASGLKGKRIGGAYVSEKHANFIINDGHAKAADIEQLIAYVVDVVNQQQGVQLIPEVYIAGRTTNDYSQTEKLA